MKLKHIFILVGLFLLFLWCTISSPEPLITPISFTVLLFGIFYYFPFFKNKPNKFYILVYIFSITLSLILISTALSYKEKPDTLGIGSGRAGYPKIFYSFGPSIEQRQNKNLLLRYLDRSDYFWQFLFNYVCYFAIAILSYVLIPKKFLQKRLAKLSIIMVGVVSLISLFVMRASPIFYAFDIIYFLILYFIIFYDWNDKRKLTQGQTRIFKNILTILFLFFNFFCLVVLSL